ncbi:MAG: DUF2804 domain-containing protein [Myxococcaceae bacterium]
MTPERVLSLPEVPQKVADDFGIPQFGTYRGGLSSAALSDLRGEHQLSLPLRALKHKKWQYQLFCTNEVIALYAVADLAYTSNAFAVVVDLGQKKALCDVSFLGPPRSPLAAVNDQPGEGLQAKFRTLGAKFTASRPKGAERYRFTVDVPSLPMIRQGVELNAELLAAGGAPALTVIAPVQGGVVNVTQKWAGLLSFGEVQAGGKSFTLDGGVGGMDYTQGYLARRTKWRWAMGAGRLENGEPVGFNLVEGFNEASNVNENAVWVGDRMEPVGRARFVWNDADLLDRWTLETEDGAVRLSFKPIHIHREERDLKVVKSYFAQPVGLFDGTITLNGRTYAVKDVGGVTEDQDITW